MRYFKSIVEELNVTIDQNLLNDASLFDDPIIATVHKYKRHPIILKVNPANIRLNEDVLKTFFVFVFRRHLQDVFETYHEVKLFA